VPATLADCLAVIDGLYDPRSAEAWDRVGLVVGDLGQRVSRAVVAVDPTVEVATDAVAAGAQLLLTHHPLFLRGTSTVAETTPGGRVVAALIRGGCALVAAHTNADKARPGVSDALLAALGVGPGEPLVPDPGPPLDALTVVVPATDRERLLAALVAAGAGAVGAYEGCAWWTSGTGTFTPLPGSAPAVGEVGRRALVDEDRIELVLPPERRRAVLAALRVTHPYEEPAYALWPVVTTGRTGLGRVGELPAPEPLSSFVARVATRLPRTVVGVRATGDGDTVVRRVAVVGGAGGEHAEDAARARADVFVTSDLRHHTAQDLALPVVDVAHWAAERPWCDQAARLLAEGVLAATGQRVTVTASDRVTDPWRWHAG